MIPRFRAWLKKEKKLCDVSILDMTNKMIWVFLPKKGFLTVVKKKNDEVILMQSTGLKDKNGAEIFEGDVVRFGHLFEEGFLHHVAWDKCNAAFKLIPLDKTWSDTYFSNFEGDTLKSLEAIGNIYEDLKSISVTEAKQ